MYKGGSLGNALRRLHRPFYVQRIKQYLKQLDFHPALVVLIQQAARHDVLKFFPAPCSIYYSHDLYGYGKASEPTLTELRKCCATVDMVWTTSKIQKTQLSTYNPNVHHIPHAVDTDWWENNRHEIPEQYAFIKPPRAVYTGVFQKKIDISLLIALATKKPEWNFVFVGPVLEHNFDTEMLRKAYSQPNMHFLGEKKPEQLPGYISGASLLMLPYIADKTSRFRGLALKFYEYMISGKPIIATPYTDFETNEKDLLYISANANEWASFFDDCLRGKDLDKEQRRIALAHQNSYESRIEMQRKLLSEWFALT
jgi:glycosyltransferase involved in cell wall biosynthesis